MLAYGFGEDMVDEYVRIGESTDLKAMTRFCVGVVV